MKSAELLGHRVHPMLIVFPLGLLTIAVLFDLIWLGQRNPTLNVVSYWLVGTGVLGGLLAAVFGLWDWLGIPSHTRARRIGLIHGLSNVVAVVLFAVSWFLRRGAPEHVPSNAALTFGFVALAVALFAGWLGGELVERLGIGVDDDADVNASNSLRAHHGVAGGRH